MYPDVCSPFVSYALTREVHKVLRNIFHVVILTLFRLAVLRKWRSKYGPNATYRNLAKSFYSADKLDMVERVCQALGAPSSSVIQQQQQGI